MLNNLPQVRRLPLPDVQPPFDDELRDRAGAEVDTLPRSTSQAPGQGVLDLSLTINGVPAVPRTPAPLLVIGEPEASRIADLPDPRRWAARVAQAALECLYGPRPIQQLLRWTDDIVYERLLTGANTRPAESPINGRVRSVRTCWPAPDVVEATVIIQADPRVRSVAVRLEARYRRWLCTALDII